jgi:chlorite dismutase
MTQTPIHEEARKAAPETDGTRQFLKYSFFKVRPEWRRLPNEERRRGTVAFLQALGSVPQTMTLRTYNLVGIRGDADFLVWTISDSLSDTQALVSRILAGPLGGYLETPYSYLGMTQKSQYLGTHRHEGQEGVGLTRIPQDSKYLFVYPFTKKREWYSLPVEERQRIMGSHFRIGHKYPKIKIHTGYSFGLDDQEFVLAFEGDAPGEFLDLVQELRPTESSKYTALETPIFTCVATSPEELVKSWGG